MYHVFNRANAREKLFFDEDDYLGFVRLFARCAVIDRMRVLAWCVMPNHWHFLLWPREDNDLYKFLHRLTFRHTQYQHMRNDSIGRGHIYQGRFKSSLIENDGHLLTVCRYIELNPVRAALVPRAVDWRWSSARDHVRTAGRPGSTSRELIPVEPFPVDAPLDWERWLDEPQTDREIEDLRSRLSSGVPVGSAEWASRTGALLGVPTMPRTRGRPRKNPK